ncbi:ferritin-like domain-containing protein [Azospirillum agricola]|uniref:ferritin-like domain-containing protein n=1 Tax=Azospirillum agricola TaxID=1720247 RepID=UPI000A0F2D10|nr:ferritin family protein [Azospirillum agricola]SMH36815.1 Rubrerythrin [Azospirillum lipoferum]
MPLLHQEPPARIDDLDVLLGIAMALEAEAVLRYGQLAVLMDQRGETDTAATFRGLMAEEEVHTTAIGRWASDLGRAAPDGGSFLWLLPPDIATSWDDLVDRTRLTPYQALSLAVVNEQRAFAFYSHIAAGTGDDAVRRHAESLAREELGHAALLRRERRKAFHRQNGGGAKPARADSPAALDRLAHSLLAAAAAGHAALSERLAAAGDAAGAALLTDIAREEAAMAGDGPAAHPPTDAGATADPWSAAIAITERLAESFADVAATATDEVVLGHALTLQETTIRHLARLASSHYSS